MASSGSFSGSIRDGHYKLRVDWSQSKNVSNEGVSLLENAGHLGLPIPEKIKTVLEQLHDRAENGKEGNE